MAHILLSLFLLSTSVLAADLMLTPGHGEHVDVSSRKIRFTWIEFPGVEEYLLDVYMRGPQKPTQRLKIKGTGAEVRFKKIPSRFYWRVTPVGQEPPDQVHEVLPFERSHTIVKLGLLGTQTRLNAETNRGSSAENLAGTIFETSIEYFPEFTKREWSWVLGFRNLALEDDQLEYRERRFSGEIGKVLSSDIWNFHALYLGYHAQQMAFGRNISEYDEDLDLWSLRHLYQHHLRGRWQFELQTTLFTDFLDSRRPSISIRPGVSYHLSKNVRLDGLLALENYIVRTDDEERDEETDFYQRNISLGLGIAFLFGP